MNKRAANMDMASQEVFDVLVIGGGINGGSLYNELCSHGRRTLLIDSADFASGSSQASGMMIWGGLLYLRTGDIRTVYRLSRARDRMISELGDWTRPTSFHYIPTHDHGMPSTFIGAGIGFYWLLSGARRRPPSHRRHYTEAELVSDQNHRGAFTYEEGVLRTSDARFTLHWITRHTPPTGVPLNYCEAVDADYDKQQRLWRLVLRDRLNGDTRTARARCIVNCTGIWVDRVNARFGIASPYRHALSKGVYLGLPRHEAHRSPLIFDLGSHDDVMTYTPWGPIALWGPTETAIDQIEEGMAVDASDLALLLDSANRHLRHPVRVDDIVSLRCGIRPLAVRKDYAADRYPLELSRRSIVHTDPDLPWISVYGGKLTGARELAARIHARLRPRLNGTAVMPGADVARTPEPDLMHFPGIDQPLPSPQWCREHEYCCSLEDYLRRRTDIAQWVPRGGLGRDNGNRDELMKIARALHGDSAAAELARYENKMAEQHDRLLGELCLAH